MHMLRSILEFSTRGTSRY